MHHHQGSSPIRSSPESDARCWHGRSRRFDERLAVEKYQGIDDSWDLSGATSVSGGREAYGGHRPVRGVAGHAQMDKLRAVHAQEKREALAEFRAFKRSAREREESLQVGVPAAGRPTAQARRLVVEEGG